MLNIATAQSKPYVLLNQHPLSPLASPRGQTAVTAAHITAAAAAAAAASAAGQTSPNWLAAAHGQSNIFLSKKIPTMQHSGIPRHTRPIIIY